MLGLKVRFVCVWNFLIFFLSEYSSVWREIYCVLSQNQSIFLCEISTTNYFRRIFQKFWENQGYILYKKLWNFALLSVILFWVHIRWKNMKKFLQILSYVFCTLLRRHMHKEITKRRYWEENLRRFVFRKSVLFTLGLRLTMHYSMVLLVWIFYQTFVILCLEFWLRFEP